MLATEIEFDWDDENRKHLAAHKVAPAEFEQMLNNDPVDLEYDLIDNEKRHRSVGLTNGGRLETAAADSGIQKDAGAGGGATNSRSRSRFGPKAG